MGGEVVKSFVLVLSTTYILYCMGHLKSVLVSLG